MARFKVTKLIDFCYGHRLLEHNGKCRYLHGHNGRAEVDLEGEELDALGMVVDFGLLGDAAKGWIDANLDHRMLLCEKDPAAAVLAGLGEPLYLMADNPTAENIARLIYEQVRNRELPVCEVRLWETPSAYATYRG